MLKKKSKTLELEHEDPKNYVILPNVQENEEKCLRTKVMLKKKNQFPGTRTQRPQK